MFEVLSKDALLTQPNWDPLDVKMPDDNSINPGVTRFSCYTKCKVPSYHSDYHILYMSSGARHHIVKLRASKIGSAKNHEAHRRFRDIVSASFEPDSTVSSSDH